MAVFNPILLCEPQCYGFEHAPVNAALLGVFQYAFPERDLIFLAEKGHGQCVLELCRKNAINVKVITIKLPGRNLSHIRRILPEKKSFARIVALAKQYNCPTVVFTSLTGTGFFLQKKHLEKDSSLKFINFIHGMLQSLQENTPRKLWKKWFWFPELLRKPIHRNIRFFVYGENIRAQALHLLPHLTGHLFSLDHPVFFHDPSPLREGRTIRIGAPGIGGRSKGTHLLFALAKRFKLEIQAGMLEFFVIGPIFDKKIDQIPEFVLVPSPDKPLVRDEYEEIIRNIDYALFLYEADSYTLTASGAFMDAVAFAKPIIALENPFFSMYMDRFGDIGYLCSAFEDISHVVAQLLDGNLRQQYSAQVEALLHGREKISLQSLGARLVPFLEDFL